MARRLEFDGLYVTKQPPEEDIKGQWDRLVINTPYVHDLCFNIIFIHKVMVKSNNSLFCTATDT